MTKKPTGFIPGWVSCIHLKILKEGEWLTEQAEINLFFSEEKTIHNHGCSIWQKPWYINFITTFNLSWISRLNTIHNVYDRWISAYLACSICELATLAKTHQHPPGLCKAVIIDLLVFNSSVKSHLEHVSCAFPPCQGSAGSGAGSGSGAALLMQMHKWQRLSGAVVSLESNLSCGFIKNVWDPHSC